MTKCCRQMKQSQRAHLGSIGRKRDTVWRHDHVGRRRGVTEEEKGRRHASWADTNLIGPKNKKKSRDRFSCYKWMIKMNDGLIYLFFENIYK
jgi:hypothetical protein